MSNTLEELAALEPNWDSDGAQRISPAAIAAAREILATAGQPIPRNDGGIDLVWIVNDKEICLEIAPDGDQRFEQTT